MKRLKIELMNSRIDKTTKEKREKSILKMKIAQEIYNGHQEEQEPHHRVSRKIKRKRCNKIGATINIHDEKH